MKKTIADDAMPKLAHAFEATLGHANIQCHTLAGAIILQFAEHALTTDLELPYDVRTLDGIAEVLRRYDQHNAAERLLRRATE